MDGLTVCSGSKTVTKHNCAARFWRTFEVASLLAICIALASVHGTAQSQSSPVEQRPTVSALMVSDIHFEPFWDPAKTAQLAAAPSSQWRAILAVPASPGREQRFDSLQQACHSHGLDTSFDLYASSLRAIQAQAAQAKFVTVSGDLISHEFQCKYSTVFPQAKPGDYRLFVEKTIQFVVTELENAMPGVPVYPALGNNDSDCGDYQLDAHSEFLSALSGTMTKAVPAAGQAQAARDFAAGGNYSVSLPAPVQNARLLVLDNLFMSRKYSTCAAKPDPSAATAQIAWLRRQLESARKNKESIWVMGHIPPGIDPYSTVAKFTDVCGGKAPTEFLGSEEMAETMAEFGDVIELAIFAHTHFDEIRMLNAPSSGQKGVAVKMVASISPNHGNNPSFTIAQIDPATARMMDYKVVAASSASAADPSWQQEYNFASAYHESDFSSSSLEKLITGFKGDSTAQTEASKGYIRSLMVRGNSAAVQMFWPEYVCALSNFTADSFRSCMCR